MQMAKLNIQHIYTKLHLMLLLSVLGSLLATQAHAAASLEDISFTSVGGDQIEVTLHMSGDAPEPGSFTIDNPARIALDFPATKSNLKSKRIDVGIGLARNINAVEAGGRTRVVINLARLTPYTIDRKGNNIVVNLGATGAGSQGNASSSNDFIPEPGGAGNIVQDVQFRRGESGQGRVVVTVSNPNTIMDMSRRGDQIIMTLQDVNLPENLERRLDVLDFGTPVRTIDAFKHGNDVRVVVTGAGQFEHLGYQSDNRINLDVKKFVKPKDIIQKKKKKQYTGERLSLNFQNIEVRAVLQLIADFTGVNMVTSDSVEGNVTLRLKNVPWDQALDIILKTKGLDKRQKGNVMLVAPAAELAAQEKIELEAQRQVVELAPIISESIQVNYAKASELATILQTENNSLVSKRGSVTVDQRTNKLLVQDTAANIDAIVALVEELDIAIRQVLIESRIVLVTTNYSHELGVRFGVSTEGSSGSSALGISGSSTSANTARTGTAPGLADRLNVDLPVSGAAGSIGLAIAKLPFGTLLDLELSAAEAEGQTEIVSSPKVITSDQHQARILTGQEIPYLQSSGDAGTSTIAFKEAVLKLEVTPSITPDDRVNLDLLVTKDSADFANAIFTGTNGFGAPPINKNEVTTRVLVDNGETIVLGGVYEQTKTNSVTRVPFFGDLPLVGFLFRTKSEEDDKSELLIFVTPKIVKQDATI